MEGPPRVVEALMFLGRTAKPGGNLNRNSLAVLVGGDKSVAITRLSSFSQSWVANEVRRLLKFPSLTVPVTLCVVGLGRIGAAHFTNAMNNRKFKIVAVCDPIEERRKDFAERGDCKGYASLNAALADTANHFEAVFICTPTGEHPAGIRGP